MYSVDYYYPRPFAVDEKRVYILSKDGQKAFNILSDDTKLIDSIVAKLNSNTRIKFEGKFTHALDDGALIRLNGEKVLLVRGWGMLTGVETYNLKGSDAKSIIDSFIENVLTTLNLNNKVVCQEKRKQTKKQSDSKKSKK